MREVIIVAVEIVRYMCTPREDTTVLSTHVYDVASKSGTDHHRLVCRGRPDQVIRPQRAIVTLDDRITYTDEDWARLWVQENGVAVLPGCGVCVGAFRAVHHLDQDRAERLGIQLQLAANRALPVVGSVLVISVFFRNALGDHAVDRLLPRGFASRGAGDLSQEERTRSCPSAAEFVDGSAPNADRLPLMLST